MVRPLEHCNLLWQRKLRQAERNKLHERPQITGAVAQQILRGHPSCQQRHNAPLAITERLYKALRWTKQGGLPWLLLGLLVCAPLVRAQVAGFDRQPVEIFGTVFLEGANRSIGNIFVNIRSTASVGLGPRHYDVNEYPKTLCGSGLVMRVRALPTPMQTVCDKTCRGAKNGCSVRVWDSP